MVNPFNTQKTPCNRFTADANLTKILQMFQRVMSVFTSSQLSHKGDLFSYMSPHHNNRAQKLSQADLTKSKSSATLQQRSQILQSLYQLFHVLAHSDFYCRSTSFSSGMFKSTNISRKLLLSSFPTFTRQGQSKHKFKLTV